MIKFNACIFYLGFLGAYFLWLLLKKRFKEFFSRALIFLSGIAIISGIFVIYYAAMGGLSDFIDTYFLFNIHYGSKGGWLPHYMREWIPFSTQLVTTILILFSAVTVCISFKAGKGYKPQKIVYFIIGTVVYVFTTSASIYFYSFIVLLPIYILVRSRSTCLSADVTAAYDPNFADVYETRNSSIGKGSPYM